MKQSAGECRPGEKPRDIKLTNRRLILQLLRQGEKVSLGQLAESCGLSRNTVKKSMDYFLEKGIAIDAGKGSSTSEGGKKPDMFVLNENWGILCSFYCKGSQIHGALYSIGMNLIIQSQEKAPDHTPESTVDSCDRLYRNMLEKAGLSSDMLKAVTCSIHGVVDIHTGIVFSSIGSGWNGQVPLGDMLHEKMGAPVFCCNPVRSMLLCESYEDPAVRENSALLYTNGSGAMAALIRGGVVVQGKRCVLGEISGIPLNFTAHPDSEKLGGDGLGDLVCKKRLRSEIASNPALYSSSILSMLGHEPELSDIFMAAERGDELGQAVIRYAARWFAVSIRQLLFLADPDIIILQGDYADAGEYFLSTLKRYVQSYVAPAVSVIPDIRISRQDEITSCIRGGGIIAENGVFSAKEMYE